MHDSLLERLQFSTELQIAAYLGAPAIPVLAFLFLCWKIGLTQNRHPNDQLIARYREFRLGLVRSGCILIYGLFAAGLFLVSINGGRIRGQADFFNPPSPRPKRRGPGGWIRT